MTLGDLLLRITDAQPYVRASMAANTAGNPFMRLDLYNPPDTTTDISVIAGTSNFVSVFGLNDVETEHLEEASAYGNAAGMIQLALTVKENLDTIAAAGDDGSGFFPGPGNNDNAIAIASLQSSTTAVSNTTFDDYYTSIIGELGSRARTAGQLVNNQSVLLDQLNVQRESIRGVNIDEEATFMITFQRIYEGAARVTQVVDSMLDTLINRTGA
jgi:flagellar hook-associated protein FlgK